MSDLPAGVDPHALRGARWATRAQFLALGAMAGSWGVHVPSAKARYGLDDGGVALALLAAAAGAVATLTQAGRLVSRLGARGAARAGGLLMCAALAATLAGEHAALLFAAMLAMGAGSALFDVAINAEGTLLETLSARKVMSGFHAMFSLGGMLAAAAGALALGAAVPPPLQVAVAGALLAVLVLLAARRMLPVHPADPGRRDGWRLPRGALALLGLLGALGLVAEGAMYDWSVLYLREEAGAPATLAALGYASFSAAMAATRFAGDWLRARIAPARLLAGSALLAASSMAVVLAARDPWVGLVGFALAGAGFANVVPILFMAATRVPGVAPAAAIASVSSVGYLGFLAGPPLIGAIAHAHSLTAGLSVVVAGALLLALGARRLPA